MLLGFTDITILEKEYIYYFDTRETTDKMYDYFDTIAYLILITETNINIG